MQVLLNTDTHVDGRKGMAALLLGRQTQKVLTHCQLPVLVVR